MILYKEGLEIATEMLHDGESDSSIKKHLKRIGFEDNRINKILKNAHSNHSYRSPKEKDHKLVQFFDKYYSLIVVLCIVFVIGSGILIDGIAYLKVNLALLTIIVMFVLLNSEVIRMFFLKNSINRRNCLYASTMITIFQMPIVGFLSRISYEIAFIVGFCITSVVLTTFFKSSYSYEMDTVWRARRPTSVITDDAFSKHPIIFWKYNFSRSVYSSYSTSSNIVWYSSFLSLARNFSKVLLVFMLPHILPINMETVPIITLLMIFAI